MSSTDTSARSGAPIHDRDPAADTEPAELAWRQADEDVFVATSRGEFAGFVTVDDTAHVVHDRHSRRIGCYPSLAAARQALVDATRPPSRSRERLHRRILSRRR
ncbi:hypothetical protein AB0O65_00920 [Microbacterium sp. NPDC077391]|uniref:Uncharacterized protein n=1 Tax=Microbacterium commune TaxID=2762219 RepID=A0ABR8W3K2_9MICO|nr:MULTISPECIES: hypothetical protein [Microbacterium]MBD8011563.1 hypothetical protein [Microbacterium commune]OIU88039.1 hypothetical protein BFN01_06465 [Microbacterium sp. AR7-10]